MLKKIIIYGNGRQSKFFAKLLKKNLIYRNLSWKLVKKINPNLVIVSNSNEKHLTIIKKLKLKQNTLLLCEKPLCRNYNEAKKISKILNINKKKLFVNYQYRYEPYIVNLINFIKKINVKEINSILIDWNIYRNLKKDFSNFRNFRSKGGGVINDLGSHVIDYLIYIFGLNLKIIKVIKKKKIFQKNKYAKYFEKSDVENNAKIFLKINNKTDVIINLSTTSNSKSYHKIQVKSKNNHYYSLHKYPFRLCDMKIKIKIKKNIKIIKYKSKNDSRKLATIKLIKDLFDEKKNVAMYKESLELHKILKKINNEKL